MSRICHFVAQALFALSLAWCIVGIGVPAFGQPGGTGGELVLCFGNNTSLCDCWTDHSGHCPPESLTSFGNLNDRCHATETFCKCMDYSGHCGCHDGLGQSCP